VSSRLLLPMQRGSYVTTVWSPASALASPAKPVLSIGEPIMSSSGPVSRRS
jgi:hypothetical protein